MILLALILAVLAAPQSERDAEYELHVARAAQKIKEKDWKGFFGTGYWIPRNTFILDQYVFTAEGKTSDMQEGFVSAGVCKPFKPHLRYYRATPERFDPDPTPEDWEAKSQGINSYWSDNFLVEGLSKEPQRPRSEVQAWKRILETWSWLERIITRYKNHQERTVAYYNNSFLSNYLTTDKEQNQLSGVRISLNYSDWRKKEQQREEDKDHWLHLKTYFARDLEEYIEGSKDFFHGLFEEAKNELWELREEVEDE